MKPQTICVTCGVRVHADRPGRMMCPTCGARLMVFAIDDRARVVLADLPPTIIGPAPTRMGSTRVPMLVLITIIFLSAIVMVVQGERRSAFLLIVVGKLLLLAVRFSRSRNS